MMTKCKQLTGILCLTACLAAAAKAASPGGAVALTEEEMQNLGIRTVLVEESDFERTAFALGHAAAIPERRAYLSSRIAGRVRESRMKIGALVKAGDPLVLLESRQPGDPPPAVWLEAPAEGTILALHTALGAPVEPADSLAEIADLHEIYLVAVLPQAVAGQVSPGTIIRARFPLLGEEEFTGKMIRHAAYGRADASSAVLDDGGSRDRIDINSAEVIFLIDNPERKLRPGMSAECAIVLEERQNVFSVPREAVHGDPLKRYVYVKNPWMERVFDRVIVQIGETNNDRVEIVDGLYEGDEVVTRGSYSLGFAGAGGGVSLKEALDAAHGHKHNEDGSEMSAEQATAADEDHDHDSEGNGGASLREKFFMGTTGVLALGLLLTPFLGRKGRTEEGF